MNKPNEELVKREIIFLWHLDFLQVKVKETLGYEGPVVCDVMVHPMHPTHLN